MTIAEATNIADSALEHTVRTILASLQAPEILKSTAGKLSYGCWSWPNRAGPCVGRHMYISCTLYISFPMCTGLCRGWALTGSIAGFLSLCSAPAPCVDTKANSANQYRSLLAHNPKCDDGCQYCPLLNQKQNNKSILRNHGLLTAGRHGSMLGCTARNTTLLYLLL